MATLKTTSHNSYYGHGSHDGYLDDGRKFVLRKDPVHGDHISIYDLDGDKGGDLDVYPPGTDGSKIHGPYQIVGPIWREVRAIWDN